MKYFMPQLRALNFWTLKQKIKDHTIQKTSTIQLLQKIDIYQLSDIDRAKMTEIADGKEQQTFLKLHGVLKRTTGEMKSHSCVLQFLQTIEQTIAHPHIVLPDYIVMKDTGGTNRTGAYYYCNGLTFAPGGEAPSTNAVYGILVGTGTTAPATADYDIETQISHGVAAGNLQYGACSVSAAGVVGANVDLVIVRPFINGSAGTVTIRNIGLVLAFHFDAGTQRNFLWAHDAVNQAVATTEVALVSYDFRTTV